MKRWTLAFLVAVLSVLAVLGSHHSEPSLLQDTDTHVLIQTIREKHAPFSWFVSDWPLYNHFYRPIPTLTFELDSRLYGNNAAGYGWTNALLAAGCVLCLFWFLREITDKAWCAAAGTALFAIWQTMSLPDVEPVVWLLGGATLLVGVARHKKDWRKYIPAVLTLWVLGEYLYPLHTLEGRVIGWLPGRTASTMTLFALASMAAYARYERLGGLKRPEASITPLTPPATRNTASTKARYVRWPWGMAALVFAALCFACYEQAVMLPACLLAVAVTFRLYGYRPNWFWQIGFWSLLLGYLELRHIVIPAGASAYQKQQIRSSVAGAMLELGTVGFPPIVDLLNLTEKLDAGLLILMDGAVWSLIFNMVAHITAYYQLRREWVLAFAGWGMSLLALLPMAFLKFFEHYYYWPMALRTIFVLALGSVTWKLVTIAWSLPAVQAPARPSPAPGSLPRR